MSIDNISGGNCRSTTSQGDTVDRQHLRWKLSIDNISGGNCRSTTSQGEIVDRQHLRGILSIDNISGGNCRSTTSQGKIVEGNGRSTTSQGELVDRGRGEGKGGGAHVQSVINYSPYSPGRGGMGPLAMQNLGTYTICSAYRANVYACSLLSREHSYQRTLTTK